MSLNILPFSSLFFARIYMRKQLSIFADFYHAVYEVLCSLFAPAMNILSHHFYN